LEVELVEPIRILIVDDDSANVRDLRESFEFELEKVDLAPVWIPDTYSSYRARQAIRLQSNKPIDVAMVDLCLANDSENTDGANVIDDVRRYHPDAYIILYTQMIQRHSDFKERHGGPADVSLMKYEMRDSSTWPLSKIAQKIDAHLISIGRKGAGATNYRQDDVGIMSVLEEVGHDAQHSPPDVEGARILRSLAFDCLDGLVDQDRDLTIEFLAAGRSGANVCKLDFDGANQPRESFVLKFGLDEGALKKELSRNAEAVRVLGQSPLMSIVGKLGSHKGGHRAITANFASSTSNNVMALRKWLISAASPSQAATAAQELLSDQLRPLFESAKAGEVAVDNWISLRPGGRLRTLAVIERYGNALDDARACGVTDSRDLVQRLSSFVSGDRTVAGAPSPERMVKFVKSFGDLHSNNVLIQLGVNPRPILVDASLYGQDHWSADNARILIDLLLRVRNSGVEAMLWPAVAKVDEQVVLLCPECQSPESLASPEDGATGAFIAQAVSQLYSSTHRELLAVPSVAWHWEWHVGLARELLRQASYEDLSPPRACMGLLLADQHLRIAKMLPQ
jgi:CheY-like chemotaxis protein